MAVAVNSTAAAAVSAGTTDLQWSLDNAAGTGIIIRTSVFNVDANAVSYGGVSLGAASAASGASSDGDRAAVYTRFDSIPTGTNTARVQFPSSEECVAHALTITGEHATNPLHDADAAVQNSSGTSITLPAMDGVADGMFFDCIAIFGRTVSAGASGQSIQYQEANGGAEDGAGGNLAGVASVALSYTWAGGARAAMAAVSIAPAAGGGGDQNRVRFPAQTSAMGVGGMLGGNRVN